ncbi:hypothetical protein EVAR_102569_1 [Eumeta japonica]|uniref:Uncharacterized protein n=1 Tax=Eumeta variegata TaxID=151549 RepID=A0A4C1SNP8_EUMVA|nr:hypothetical protein EVAR_102569_1 [Eumeta japonica]
MKWKLLSGMFGWTSARPHDRPSFPLLFQCVMPFAVVAVSAAQYVLAPLTSVVADATATLGQRLNILPEIWNNWIFDAGENGLMEEEWNSHSLDEMQQEATDLYLYLPITYMDNDNNVLVELANCCSQVGHIIVPPTL